jgi:hypothetical protein
MKNLRISTITLLILQALINISAHTTPQLNHILCLATAIMKAPHEAKRNQARDQLLQIFKQNPKANSSLLSTVITAYHHKKDTLLYSQYADTLNDAVRFFSPRLGFAEKISELLSHANDESFIKGHMYELETALKLEKRGDMVTCFGYSFYSPLTKNKRTIDLATQSQLVECKNIRWKLYNNDNQESTLKIKQQLICYQSLSLNVSALRFVLHSKQPITRIWKRWLDDNHIEYEEGENN